MTAPALFDFNGTALRAELVDGEPWFVAADVAQILGYRMASDMTRRLPEEDRGTRSVRTPSGDQDMTVISEVGLYVAVLGSQVPGAKEFKRWVTHDVLPAIRRTGAYGTPRLDLANPADVALIVQAGHAALVSLQEARAEIEANAPALAVHAATMAADGDYSLREAAEILARDPNISTGQNRLAKYLHTNGWTDRRGLPYQRQIDAGRLAVRSTTYEHPHSGETVLSHQVRVTAKGMDALHRLMTAPEPTRLQVVS